MITRFDNVFHLETAKTSYIFQVLESGHLQHLYYGKHLMLDSAKDAQVLAETHEFPRGNTNSYDDKNPALTLEDICLEMSSWGKGDIREPFVSVTFQDGSSTSDFLFEAASISQGKPELETLPASYDAKGVVDTLCLRLRDVSGLVLLLNYHVFEDCHVIARSAKLVNESNQRVTVNRLMSTQLDFDCGDYSMTSFGGGWAREMKRTVTPLKAGKHVNESLTGTSSSRANPFVMIHDSNADEDSGTCYGIHLVYSGNHYEAAQVSSFGKLRFVAGIHPDTFSWQLEAGDSFEAPESFMTCSSSGFSQMSKNLHDFIREHIVRGNWQYKERPVLVNSWEAMYFNVSESKIMGLAKASAEVGAELFVLDDGWFGTRDDDTQALGDWTVNKKKFPHGLGSLANKINKLGLDFGIWVEPEMVNVNSQLFRNHPDWTIEIPDRDHSQGRNQRILDLSRQDVQDYIIGAMTDLLNSAAISYVKWDMNRTFTDIYSRDLGANQQGEVIHRYYIGLYRIMKTLTQAFPEVLFEGCSAGGNRFDTGILCYFPQIWASDNTDAVCRSEIQTNYSYGYPQSTLGCHLSSCPNHQTLRNVPLSTRFRVASFGLLGYECNLEDMSGSMRKRIAKQIELYKKYRQTLQYGDFYRGNQSSEPYSVLQDTSGNTCQWTVVSKDQSTAIGLFMQYLAIPNSPSQVYYPKGLDPDARYDFKGGEKTVNLMDYGELINTVSPIHIKNGSYLHKIIAHINKIPGETEEYTARGSVLMAGVRLKPAYSATGINEGVRHFPDFASRLYIIDK